MYRAASAPPIGIRRSRRIGLRQALLVIPVVLLEESGRLDTLGG